MSHVPLSCFKIQCVARSEPLLSTSIPSLPFHVRQERESKIIGSIVAAALEKLEEFAPVKLVFWVSFPFCPFFGPKVQVNGQQHIIKFGMSSFPTCMGPTPLAMKIGGVLVLSYIHEKIHQDSRPAAELH